MSKDKPSNRSRFVLVYSAWLGGWAWGHVASILEKEGHGVVAPDLPAHGKDKTPPSQVTLNSYVKVVTDILESQSEPVILVGHSLGGIIISQAADKAIPPAVQRAMYTATPVKQVFSMNTSHAPNFSAPEELARYLVLVAAGQQAAA